MHHRIVHRLLGCPPKPKPITDNSVFPLSTTKNHISISLATQKPTDYPFLWQQLSPAAQLLEMHLMLWAVSAAQNLSPTPQFFFSRKPITDCLVFHLLWICIFRLAGLGLQQSPWPSLIFPEPPPDNSIIVIISL